METKQSDQNPSPLTDSLQAVVFLSECVNYPPVCEVRRINATFSYAEGTRHPIPVFVWLQPHFHDLL